MNYYPFFRGKLYELLVIRENAQLIAANGFTPIIEPVKEQDSALRRALDALTKADAKFLVVANPTVGFHSETLGPAVADAVEGCLSEYGKGGWIFHVGLEDNLGALTAWLARHPTSSVLHNGSASGAVVAAAIAQTEAHPASHVFTARCSRLYWKHFKGSARVAIADGFPKRNNREYPDSELFSDLNATFSEDGLDGFGDYLIVGNEYSESGGPAFAVAIHITYFGADEALYVRHFVSDRVDTPTDTPGKFLEALKKLVDEVNNSAQIKRTSAISEFIRLHELQHFPGLGYVKKLSMQHHLELLAG